MIDEERAALFSELDRVVREAGLDWIADEVSVLIDQGVEMEVAPEEWSGRGKPTRNELRITRREYTPLERIELLTGAMIRVVTQALAVERAVLEYFQPARTDFEPASATNVRFRSEPRLGDTEVQEFTLSSQAELTARGVAIAQLAVELHRVRDEAAER